MPAISSAVLAALLATPDPPGLGSGPRPHVLAAATLEPRLDEFGRQHATGARQQELLRALVLLWHDQWHVAHTIVQELADADAAFIHGIIHRREPDYWNAKYWFRRVGTHPLHPVLGALAVKLAATAEREDVGTRCAPGGVWDPMAFVDFVQEVAALPVRDPGHQLAVTLQEAESRLLLEHLGRIH